jgi:hypothetical protein
MAETRHRLAPLALVMCSALSAYGCTGDAARGGPTAPDSEAASSDESGIEAGPNEPLPDAGPGGNESNDDSLDDGPGDAIVAPMETDATLPAEVGSEQETGASDAHAAAEGSAPVDGSADSSDAQPIPIVGMVQPCAMPFASGTTLLDLGHAQPIAVLKQSGDRVLSEDLSGHWILWDTSSRLQVASGDADSLPPGSAGLSVALSPNLGSNLVEPYFGSFALDMAAGTIAVPTMASVTLLSSIDGHPMRTIPLPAALVGTLSAFGLATDGSYLWVASASSLNAWSTSGKMLVNLPGFYLSSSIFAAPTELRVGQSPQANGDNAFELVSMSTGLPTKTQVLNDRFESWFNDGSRFMTASRGNVTTVTIYSAAGVKQSAQVLPFTAQGIVGQGGYFWSTDSNFPNAALQVFAAGGGTMPVWIDQLSSQAPTTPMAAGNFVAFKDSASGPLNILDLSGPAVAESAVPFSGSADFFDADPTGNWAVSSGSLVFDSADATGAGGPEPLDCGQVSSIAGAASGRVALSTEAGQILYIDIQETPRTLVGALGFAADKLAISSDGTVLAAAMLGAGPLRVFDLPSGSNPMTWTYAGGPNGPFLFDFSLSLGGTTIGQITEITDDSARTHPFTRTLAEGPTWSASLTDALVLPFSAGGGLPSIALSPSGAFAALCDFQSSPPVGSATTNIFNGGRLVGSAHGYPVQWLDDERLLVQTFADPDSGFGISSYLGSSVCDPQGNVTALAALPEVSELRAVGANQVYSPFNLTLYNLVDGSVAWTSPVLGPSNDLAGSSFLVVATDHRVIVEAHP